MRISDWSSDVCSSDLVGEQDIDLPAVDQRAEIGAVAVDAKAVRQREGDLAASRARRFDRHLHRRARGFGVPEIALQIKDRRRTDKLRIDIGGGKMQNGRASCGEGGCPYV